MPVAHHHSMGLCIGQLVIQRGKLTYKTKNPDGFEIAPSNLQEIDIRRLSKPMIANETVPNWLILEIRFRDPGGHEKKYDMLPYVYAKQHGSTGKNFASTFEMDDSDLLEMQKFEHSMLALIQKYVK